MNLLDSYVIDWQAWATFATGVAAVGGAIYVGRRQTEISHRQNQILERQTELEELKLKSELYERRFEIFSATDTFVAAMLDVAAVVTDETEAAFQRTIDKSRFLFRDSVTHDLGEIAESAYKLRRTRHKLDRMDRRDEGRAEKQGAEPEAGWSRAVVEGEIIELEERLEKILASLPEIFGHELQLGAKVDPSLPAPPPEPR